METKTNNPLPARIIVTALWLLMPLPAIILYNVADYSSLDTAWGISMALGLEAFTWFCFQLVLASRLFGLDKKTGTAWFIRFHAFSGIMIVFTAIAHRILKINVIGFSENSQTLFGTLALMQLFMGSLLTLVLMSPTFPAKLAFIKKLRQFVKEKLHLDYPRLRLTHNILILVLALAFTHVILASTSAASPSGTIYLAALLGISLSLYLRYRLHGRT